MYVFPPGTQANLERNKTINTTQGIGIKITEVTEGEFSLRVWPDVELGAVWR